MDSMIAYCGLICSDCPAYLATQADDREALERVAAEWREVFNTPDITADTILCDGCIADGRKSGYCSMCEIRACGVRHGVDNCAHCDDYVREDAVCEKLEGFFAQAAEARPVLDEIRASL